MSKPTNQVTVLKKTRDLIAKGWTRGTFHTRHGNTDRYCLLGGIRETKAPYTIQEVATRRIVEAIYQRRGIAPYFNLYDRDRVEREVWTFNDASNDKRRVLKVLDLAIANAERARATKKRM